MATELKKHVAAVHTRGSLTLLQRKISNVLLLNAYEELPDQEVFEHSIALKTLAEVAGFDSNDYQLLRDALEALVDIKIRWNILDDRGQEEWGVSSFLAQAVTRNGRCRYAYPPELRRKLFKPEIYARINLAVQQRFGSGYALALYENCVRFRKVGSTGWISLEDWRHLLGVDEGQYEQFKYLNRDVLKPAVNEVNRYSDIRVEMHRKRSGRRIASLKFTIQENEQLHLEMDDQAHRAAAEAFGQKVLASTRALAPEPDCILTPLQNRLTTFGLTPPQAIDLDTEHDAEHILRNLKFVEAELERGRQIKNVPAFTIAAIREDYGSGVASTPAAKRPAARHASQAEQQQREVEAARRREAEAAQRYEAQWQGLGEKRRAAVMERVVARMRREVPFLADVYDREREAGEEHSVGVRATLRTLRNEELAGL